MKSPIPDSAIIETAKGPESISIDDWSNQSDSDKIQFLARRQIKFYSRGREIPIREALSAITHPNS